MPSEMWVYEIGCACVVGGLIAGGFGLSWYPALIVGGIAVALVALVIGVWRA